MKRFFTKIVDVKPNEIHALLLAFVFNFVVLGGYYVIRPIRDEIGADSGVENLPWMYTVTLIGMLIANALYAAIVTRMSRRRFIPIAYRFAIANLFVFFLLMRWMPAAQERRSLRPYFSSGSASSIFSPQQCFGRSWPTFSHQNKPNGFSDLLLSADRLAESSVVWSRVRSPESSAPDSSFSSQRSCWRLRRNACAYFPRLRIAVRDETDEQNARNRSAVNSGKARRTLLDLPTYLVCGVSHDLHAHEHVGIFSTI